MKRFLYIILFPLLFWSCTQGKEGELAGERGDLITFSVKMPDYQILRSGAEDESAINSLELWIFNEQGLFTQRSHAKVQSLGGGKYAFTARVNKSKAKRTIHFVANYSLPEDKIADWLGRDERELIPAIERTKDEAFVMWQRKEYELIEDKQDLGPVSLLRNKAKILLVVTTGDLLDVSYALHNNTRKGTIAPFDGISFNEQHVTPVMSNPLYDTQESDFVPAETPIFAYEQSNQENVDTHPYLLIKARLKGQAEFRYFKLDLVDSKEKSQRFDIKRNQLLKIIINGVKGAPEVGRKTLEEAKRAIPDNNFALSEEMQPYPSFSDGKGLLRVEKPSFVVVDGVRSLTFKASYYPDKGKLKTQNNQIEVIRKPNDKIITNASVSSDGMVTLQFAALPKGVIYNSEVIVRVKGQGDLQRRVKIQIRDKYNFVSIRANHTDVSNNNPCSVWKSQGSPMTIKLKLPKDFSKALLPLRIRFFTEHFYPNDDQGLALGFENRKTYWEYLMTQIPVDNEITVNFKSNKSNSAEDIKIDTKPDVFQVRSFRVINTGRSKKPF
ncbi:hypothetical protein [Porphyromonas macacae]|uniref:hypothetical protein n=1 Tax=Porphyromonas macacae TaxID=28115 RepID=UPI0035A04F36